MRNAIVSLRFGEMKKGKKESRNTKKGSILTGLLREGLDRVPGPHLR